MPNLSQAQELIVLAHTKGYKIINNECITPKNKKLAGTIKTHPVPYKQFSMHTPTGARTVYFHSLLAYQLYGERYFEKGIVARHLNGNSLDNSPTNIILGTQKDNRADEGSYARSIANGKARKTLKLLTPEVVAEIEKDYRSGTGAKLLYKKYNTCLNTMYILIRKFNKL